MSVRRCTILLSVVLSGALSAFASALQVVKVTHTAPVAPITGIKTTSSGATSLTPHIVPSTNPLQANPHPKRTGAFIKLTPLYSQPRYVSMAFIRMYYPDTIVEIAGEVKAGKANISFLSSVVGDDLASRLVQSDLQPLGRQIHLRSGAGMSNSILGDGMQAPTMTGINFGTVTSNAGPPPFTLPGSDFSPHSVDQGPLRENQTAYVVIKFTNPINDSVSASLDKSYSGAATISKLATYTGLWQPTPPPSGPLEPIIAQQTNGSAMQITAGQDAEVHVKLKFPHAGDYTVNLTAQGSGATAWAFTVPIKVSVTQMGDSNATAHTDDSDATLLVGKTFDLPITIEPFKFKNPFTVKISPKSLPTGISVDDRSVSVTSGSDVHTTLHIKADQNCETFHSEQIELNVDAGDDSPTTLKTHVTVEPSTIVWGFADKNSDDVTWYGPSIWMDSDGNWAIGGHLVDNYTWSSDDAAWGVFYPTAMESGIGVTETYGFPNNGISDYIPGASGSPTFTVGPATNPYVGQSIWIKNNWGMVVRFQPACWLYEGDISQGNGHSTIPTNPNIIVTEW